MSSPDIPPPDPAIGEAAKSNAEVADRALDLQEKAYADQMKLVEEYSPILREQLATQQAEQQKSIERGDAQWDSYQQNFAPLEAEMAQRAANYDTPARREAAAAEARGEVSGALSLARQQSAEQVAASGMQPGSGAASARNDQFNIAEATMRAGAANDARDRVESVGMSYLDNAARFGRNMPSTGLATAGLAQNQGAGVQGAYGTLSNAYAAPGQQSAQLLGTATSANSSAGNLYLGQQQSAMQGAQIQGQADAATWQGIGSLVGTVATLAMM
jgi:hypothetical protein